VLHFTVRDLMG